MFPIRSGLSDETKEAGVVFVQSLTCAALHEIAKRAILDTSVLFFHQMEVDTYYRQDNNIYIPEVNGEYVLYTSEEEKELRRNIRELVWKYHILHPEGLVARVSPIVDYVCSGQSVPETVLASDPFLQTILTSYTNYQNSIFNGNMIETINSIVNFSDIQNLSIDQLHALVMNSRNDGLDTVSVQVYEDGQVQCDCAFCNKFLQMIDYKIDPNYLNQLQLLMMNNFGYLDDDTESTETESDGDVSM